MKGKGKNMIRSLGNSINFTIEFCNEINVKADRNYILIEIPQSNIVVHNKSNSCMFCSSVIKLIHYKQSCICRECIKKLNDAKTDTYYY